MEKKTTRGKGGNQWVRDHNHKPIVTENSLLASTLTSSHPAVGRGSVTLARRSWFWAPSLQCVPRTKLCTMVCFSSSTNGSGNQSHVREGHSSACVTTISYRNGQFFFQILNSSLMTCWSSSSIVLRCGGCSR